MSNWTHVAGIIRIDNWNDILMHDTNAALDYFHNLLGKECLFESGGDIWDDWEKNPNKYLPGGSEGTLQLSVWENPRPGHAFTHVVSVFGDLRDDEDPNTVAEWFKHKVYEIEKRADDEPRVFSLCVRQAVITVDNEINGTVTWAMPRFE